MTRLSSNNCPTIHDMQRPYAPKNSELHQDFILFDPPSCTVPRKRRCRMGRKRKPYYYVVTTEGDLITIHEEDISTRNTFSILKDMHEEFLSKGSSYVLRSRKVEKEEENSGCRAVLRSDTINDSSMGNSYNIDFSSIKNDFCTLSMISNKSNICSGYFHH